MLISVYLPSYFFFLVSDYRHIVVMEYNIDRVTYGGSG